MLKVMISCATTTGAERVGLSVVRESGADPQPGMGSKRLFESDPTVLQACVLGLPLQGWKFDSESSVSHGN